MANPSLTLDSPRNRAQARLWIDKATPDTTISFAKGETRSQRPPRSRTRRTWTRSRWRMRPQRRAKAPRRSARGGPGPAPRDTASPTARA